MRISYHLDEENLEVGGRRFRPTITFGNWLTEVLYVRASWGQGLNIGVFMQQTDIDPVKGDSITPDIIQAAITALVRDSLCQRESSGDGDFLRIAPGIDYGFKKKYD